MSRLHVSNSRRRHLLFLLIMQRKDIYSATWTLYILLACLRTTFVRRHMFQALAVRQCMWRHAQCQNESIDVRHSQSQQSGSRQASAMRQAQARSLASLAIAVSRAWQGHTVQVQVPLLARRGCHY